MSWGNMMAIRMTRCLGPFGDSELPEAIQAINEKQGQLLRGSQVLESLVDQKM